MSGKSSELIQAKRHVAKLQAVIQLQANREGALANSARCFRELIQRYGRHLPGCGGEKAVEEKAIGHLDGSRPERPPCSCGWQGVVDFMKDDANFSRIALVKQ